MGAAGRMTSGPSRPWSSRVVTLYLQSAIATITRWGQGHPDVECLQITNDVYANYADSLNAIDSDGNVDIPQGPGYGVEYDWKAIDRLTTATKVYE